MRFRLGLLLVALAVPAVFAGCGQNGDSGRPAIHPYHLGVRIGVNDSIDRPATYPHGKVIIFDQRRHSADANEGHSEIGQTKFKGRTVDIAVVVEDSAARSFRNTIYLGTRRLRTTKNGKDTALITVFFFDDSVDASHQYAFHIAVGPMNAGFPTDTIDKYWQKRLDTLVKKHLLKRLVLIGHQVLEMLDQQGDNTPPQFQSMIYLHSLPQLLLTAMPDPGVDAEVVVFDQNGKKMFDEKVSDPDFAGDLAKCFDGVTPVLVPWFGISVYFFSPPDSHTADLPVGGPMLFPPPMQPLTFEGPGPGEAITITMVGGN